MDERRVRSLIRFSLMTLRGLFGGNKVVVGFLVVVFFRRFYDVNMSGGHGQSG